MNPEERARAKEWQQDLDKKLASAKRGLLSLYPSMGTRWAIVSWLETTREQLDLQWVKLGQVAGSARGDWGRLRRNVLDVLRGLRGYRH